MFQIGYFSLMVLNMGTGNFHIMMFGDWVAIPESLLFCRFMLAENKLSIVILFASALNMRIVRRSYCAVSSYHYG